VGWRVFIKPAGNVTEDGVPAACDEIRYTGDIQAGNTLVHKCVSLTAVLRSTSQNILSSNRRSIGAGIGGAQNYWGSN